MSKVPLKFAVFFGSARPNRLGARVYNFVLNRLKLRKHEVTVFDPIELKLPLLDTPYHFYPQGAKIPKQIEDLAQKVKEADAFLVITPEYNSTIPPALTNTMDYFPPAYYTRKPAAIVTYSISPGMGFRCQVILRPFLCELGIYVVREFVAFPQIQTVMDENSKFFKREDEELYTQRLEQAFDSVEWAACAFKEYKQKVPPPPPPY
jgi:NAD(P)H-dependent FMN reductase